MNLKKKLDLKLGSDLREKIGAIMICAPFAITVLLAVGAALIHFPIPTLFVIGFVGYYSIASWLAT